MIKVLIILLMSSCSYKYTQPKRTMNYLVIEVKNPKFLAVSITVDGQQFIKNNFAIDGNFKKEIFIVNEPKIMFIGNYLGGEVKNRFIINKSWSAVPAEWSIYLENIDTGERKYYYKEITRKPQYFLGVKTRNIKNRKFSR